MNLLFTEQPERLIGSNEALLFRAIRTSGQKHLLPISRAVKTRFRKWDDSLELSFPCPIRAEYAFIPDQAHKLTYIR
jgi:hypothetical protein